MRRLIFEKISDSYSAQKIHLESVKSMSSTLLVNGLKNGALYVCMHLRLFYGTWAKRTAKVKCRQQEPRPFRRECFATRIFLRSMGRKKIGIALATAREFGNASPLLSRRYGNTCSIFLLVRSEFLKFSRSFRYDGNIT